MSEPIWFALEGKVAGDVARDTKITVASINTCKNRQKAGAAGASMAAMLIYSVHSHDVSSRLSLVDKGTFACACDNPRSPPKKDSTAK